MLQIFTKVVYFIYMCLERFVLKGLTKLINFVYLKAWYQGLNRVTSFVICTGT